MHFGTILFRVGPFPLYEKRLFANLLSSLCSFESCVSSIIRAVRVNEVCGNLSHGESSWKAILDLSNFFKTTSGKMVFET